MRFATLHEHAISFALLVALALPSACDDSVELGPGDSATAHDGSPSRDDAGQLPDALIAPSDGGAADEQVTVRSGPVACPSGGTCYGLRVSCPDVEPVAAWVRILKPDVPRGTVVFSAGAEPPNVFVARLYFGAEPTRAEPFVTAGLTTVEVVFRSDDGDVENDGINDGAAGQSATQAAGGMRSLACRYWSVARWAHDDPSIHDPSLPFGATGNSGGGAIVAYGLAHGGLDEVLDRAVLTGSPVLTHVDRACLESEAAAAPLTSLVCDFASRPASEIAPTTEWFGLDPDAIAPKVVDNAYGYLSTEAGPCEAHDASWSMRMRGDGILAEGARTTYPQTDVTLIMGVLDSTVAPMQATSWQRAVTAFGGAAPSVVCLPRTPHAVPFTDEGRAAILDAFSPEVFVRHHVR